MEENKSDIQLEPKEKGDNKLLAALSYIGPLSLVSYFTGKDDAFVRFHARQGLSLFILWVAVWIVSTTFWFFGLWVVWNIIKFILFVFMVIGLWNVFNGHQKPLPLIGSIAERLKL